MAGVASNVPDLDGIPMLFDMQRFESGHRVWGHSIMSIFLASLLLGFFQIGWDWIGFIANRFPVAMPKKRSCSRTSKYGMAYWRHWWIRFCVNCNVCTAFNTYHANMVVSGVTAFRTGQFNRGGRFPEQPMCTL